MYWQEGIGFLLMSGGLLILGLRLRPGDYDEGSPWLYLTRYAKYTSLIAAVAGIILALRLLIFPPAP